jgi:hypothetical protein
VSRGDAALYAEEVVGWWIRQHAAWTLVSNHHSFRSPALNAKLYVAGDIRDIPGLKTLAVKKYTGALSTDWDVGSFVSSLELIHQETREEDRLLKEIALSAALKHLVLLLESEPFCVLCKKVGEISKETPCNRPEGGFWDRGCPECGGQVINNDLCAACTKKNYAHSIYCEFSF